MLRHFNFWLTGAGWAEAFFTSDEQTIRFDISYLSDPLADLIVALLSLHRDLQRQVIVDFYNEPGLHRLSMTMMDNHQVQMQIRNLERIEGNADVANDWKSTIPTFEVTDALDNIMTVIHTGMLDLRKRHSDEDYLKQWINHPFPSAVFKTLEKIVVMPKS